MYDPSFLGAYGRLRQREMLADARRRAVRRKAKPARAGRREQRAERYIRYSLLFWRSVARIRRKPSKSALAAGNQPPRAQRVEVVFEPGPASHRDVVELLVVAASVQEQAVPGVGEEALVAFRGPAALAG